LNRRVDVVILRTGHAPTPTPRSTTAAIESTPGP
jgi:hypothetical protein